MIQDLAIGIFDSGVGGLTVLKALKQKLPHARFYYFADLAHVPYGNKTKEQLLHYSLQIADFFMEKKVDHLVVACHTISTTVFEELCSYIDIPVTGMIHATVDALSKQLKKDAVALLATPAAIASGFYQSLFKQRFPSSKIYGIACSRFVPLIEEGALNTPELQQAIEETLSVLKAHPIDTALLGCTHFPLIGPAIQNTLGDTVALIDPANCLADHLCKQLPPISLPSIEPLPIEFYTSQPSPYFAAFVQQQFPQASIFPVSLQSIFI